MRRTGIRVGELTDLRFDCLKTNLNNHSFLKVELGKLYTERMVPLHEDTVKLIKKIQTKTLSSITNPEKLIHLDSGGKPVSREFMLAFYDITRAFKTEKPLVTHQLRHTFACEMLNNGMSLVALKEILGHRTIQMTLHYAAVTQVTLRDEFLRAYNVISKQYELPRPAEEKIFRPEHALNDIVSYLKSVSSLGLQKHQKGIQLIIRRLFRIKNQLNEVLTEDLKTTL